MSDLIRYEVKNRIAVLTVDNPPVNALGPGVLEGIEAAVARGCADADVDAMVLIGAGTTFIAGADIKIFGTLKSREQSLARSEAHARATAAHRGRDQDARGRDPRQRARRRPRSGDVLPLSRDGGRRQGRSAGSAARHHSRRWRHAATAAPVRRRHGDRDVHRRQARAGREGPVGRHRRSDRRREAC